MRILHVITDMRMGGAERALAKLAVATRNTGHSVEVVALKELGLAAQPLRDAGISCAALHAPETPGLGLVTTTVALAALIRAKRPDVIHAWLASACAAVHLAAPSRIPCIYGARVTDVPSTGVLAILRADRGARITWVAVSHACAKTWGNALGLPRMEVIPNGVDVDGEPAEDLEGARAVFLGRLTRQKGVDVLLDAAAECDVGIDVYGAGDLDEELRDQAQALGLDVRFPGVTDDVRGVLRRAEFLVLPSRSEGMPNVVLEAMAEGRAVVASNIPGTDEVVVDGKTGVLVPAEDPEALAREMARMHANAARRRKMGVEGWKRVRRHFSHARVVEEWLGVYARVG